MPPKKMPTKKFIMKKTSVPQSANSAKFLIIVESPSKCAKIESYLGAEYCCIASMGHIRHIAGLSSIDNKNNFAIQFDILPDKKDHVQILKSTVGKFAKKNVILATDDDREGEAIAWHICEVCNLDIETTQRILFHEITQSALVASVKTPTHINMDLVRAAHARQVLDMLVGFKISPLLWKYLYCNKTNSLSAGRCQTPALRLVYDNAQEKNAAITTYKITAIFLEKRLKFCLQTKCEISREQVQQFLEMTKNHQHILSVGKSKDTFQSAPKPFNTSQLLQTASSRLRMSPKETMSLCQKLYQEGHITYMRTESTKYSAEFLKEAAQYIDTNYGENMLADFSTLENKDIQNPHEAIRVTHIEQSVIGGQDTRASTLYRLIWQNTVESCMAQAKYETTTLTVTCPIVDKAMSDAHYTHILEIPLFLGWKTLALQVKEKPEPTEENDDLQETAKMTQEEGRGLLLYLKSIKGPVHYQQIMATVIMRNMHTHYTEASLIKKLEELGIGRPSTFAMLVDTIVDRGYVKCQDVEGITQKITEFVLTEKSIRASVKEKTFGEQKKKLVIQPVGIMTIEFLVKHFDKLFSYDYTKCMELELDSISNGTTIWHKLCENCEKDLTESMKPVAKTMKKEVFEVVQGEPEAGYSKYVVTIGQYGPVLKRTSIEDAKAEYATIKHGNKLDMEKLKRGEYNLEELIEKQNDLGEYEGFPLIIKNGKYGPYVQWGENTESLRNIGIQLENIERESLIKYLQSKNNGGENNGGENNSGDGNGENLVTNNTRIINQNLSIRVGKYGPYIFYKTPAMKKPVFHPMKKCPLKYTDCDVQLLLNWINNTYQLNETIE